MVECLCSKGSLLQGIKGGGTSFEVLKLYQTCFHKPHFPDLDDFPGHVRLRSEYFSQCLF